MESNNNNTEENKNNDTANENSNPNPAAPPPPVKAEASSAAQQQQQQQQVALKVVNADGAEMFFRIRRGTQLKKLIDAYCKKQGISRGSVRFLFDGSPIDESKTPEDLGMEDDDVIDAMVEQTGGSYCTVCVSY